MIADTLAYLYPAADPATDYRVEASDGGEQLAYWSDALGPRPTDEQIAQAALPALRAQAHLRRRALRTQAELAGFEFSGHPIDSDRDSILRIANAAASALSSILTQQPWATAWRCADEHDLPLDAAGMLGLQAALAQHGQACHTASTTIGAEIDAAETQEEVAEIIEAIPTDPRWPT